MIRHNGRGRESAAIVALSSILDPSARNMTERLDEELDEEADDGDGSQTRTSPNIEWPMTTAA